MEYPKKKSAKRRQRHKESILQKKDGRCFLCQDKRIQIVEEHHVFGGPRRKISEAEGLKVYLCMEHHRTGPAAVHTNAEVRKKLQAFAQQEWQRINPDGDWMAIMGKSYME